jgi:ribosomal protein L11 methyltransferase
MEVKIQTRYESADAIGDIFYRNGADGLVFEELEITLDKDSTVQWDYSDLPISEKPVECVSLVAYLPIDDNIFEKLEDIRVTIENLRDYGINIGTGELSYKPVDEADWQNNWKEYFKPLKIGDSFLIRPIWEEAQSGTRKVITLDPGMAFGTGSHTTTQQALILLEKYMSDDMSVIDVGCGSGILAIAAAYLGAESILALDNDEQAVAMTKSNILHNKIHDNITILENNLLEGIDFTTDIIIANITAPILLNLIPQSTPLTKFGGYFICAGIIEEYEYEIQEMLLDNGFKIMDRLQEKDWVAIAARKVR